MMKKLAGKIALAMTVASLALGTIGMTACANDTMYVNSQIGVNVRAEPDASSTKLGALENGHAVEVVKYVENGWVEIRYNGQKAYVIDCLVPGANNNTNNQASTQTGTANGNQNLTGNQIAAHMNNTFNLYKAHGFMVLRGTASDQSGSNIMCELGNGTTVQVVKYGDKFDFVYVPALNQYGYISVDYICA